MKNKNEENKEKSVAERLPELTEEERENALDEIKWAKKFIASHRQGDFQTMSGGMTLQAVSFDTVRCVRIFDDKRAWWMLSMINASFKGAGVKLQLEPHIIVTQPTEYAEGRKSEVSKKRDTVDIAVKDNFGVEVV